MQLAPLPKPSKSASTQLGALAAQWPPRPTHDPHAGGPPRAVRQSASITHSPAIPPPPPFPLPPNPPDVPELIVEVLVVPPVLELVGPVVDIVPDEVGIDDALEVDAPPVPVAP